MPIGAFKQKAFELLHRYQNEKKHAPTIDIMEPIIRELSEFFGVSNQAAKIRMVDAGFEEAIGTFTYIDGRYVKPYTFKKGSLDKNRTYSISLNDAIFETVLNQKLSKHTLSGNYVYVDSHVCLNSPKYVKPLDEGGYEMTDYARLHTDECCLAFELKVTRTNKYGEQFYRECVLYRDADSGLHFEACFSPEDSKDVLSKANAITEQGQEIIDLKATLPMVFSSSLVKLMDWKGMTVEELAEKSKLSEKTIQRLRNQADYQVNMKTVIAVCIGLQLHPILSEHLIESAGLTFRYVSQEQILYRFFITGYYTHSIDECNAMLEEKGFKRLSGDE